MNGLDSQSESSVTIDRLRNTYLVPKGHPSPDELRRRLDTALQDHLAATCHQLLSRVLETDDPSVWVIRRLDIDLALSLDVLDDESLARSLAGALARNIVRTIARGADGDAVLHFPSRAAYLAQFVADLAEGRAWNQWYFNSFDSLRSLPLSAAIREALIREPSQIEETLQQLAVRGRLEIVLNALGAGDAERIFEACTDGDVSSGTVSEERRLISSLLNVWPLAIMRASAASFSDAHNALRLYVALDRSAADLSDRRRARDVILHLLGFADILRRTETADALVRYLSTDNLRAAVELVRSRGQSTHLESLPFIHRLSQSGDADWLKRVVRVLKPSAVVDDLNRSQDEAQTISTPFGGLFLLLPSLIDFQAPELIAAAPFAEDGEIEKEQALRYLLGLKCLGRPRADAAAHDPALNLVAGLDHTPPFEKLQAFSRRASIEANEHCLRLLLEKLVRRGRVEGRALFVELVNAPSFDGEVLLLRDTAQDAWVYAALLNDDAAETTRALKRGLALVEQATATKPECLLLSAELEGRLDSSALADLDACLVWTNPAQSSDADSGAVYQPDMTRDPAIRAAEVYQLTEEMREMLSAYLARARDAATELDYFSSGPASRVVANAGFDLMWSLIARAALKEFAVRLMGFGWSSAEYLYQNFLACPCVAHVCEGRIDVQLLSPTLEVILRLAGVDGQTFTVSWLNDAQITLSLKA